MKKSNIVHDMIYPKSQLSKEDAINKINNASYEDIGMSIITQLLYYKHQNKEKENKNPHILGTIYLSDILSIYNLTIQDVSEEFKNKFFDLLKSASETYEVLHEWHGEQGLKYSMNNHCSEGKFNQFKEALKKYDKLDKNNQEKEEEIMKEESKPKEQVRYTAQEYASNWFIKNPNKEITAQELAKTQTIINPLKASSFSSVLSNMYEGALLENNAQKFRTRRKGNKTYYTYNKED